MSENTNSQAEMEKLIGVVEGRWTTYVTIAPGPTLPDGGTSKGEEESRVGPGRASIILETRADGDDGPFEGAGFIVWHQADRCYDLHWLTTLSPEPGLLRGSWEGEAATFEGFEYVAGQRLASCHRIFDIEPDSFGYTIDLGPTAETLQRAMTIRYERRR
jgi:hypothetical protein